MSEIWDMGLSAKAWMGDSVAAQWHAAGFTAAEYGAWRDFASVYGLDCAAEWHNAGFTASEATEYAGWYSILGAQTIKERLEDDKRAEAVKARRHADDVELSAYDRADDDAAWMIGSREGWF